MIYKNRKQRYQKKTRDSKKHVGVDVAIVVASVWK